MHSMRQRFLGKNCVTKCPYPTYGQDCQSKCYCNVTYCDHVSGCTETSGGKIQNKWVQYTFEPQLKYIIDNMSRYFNIFILRRYEYTNQKISVNPGFSLFLILL